MSLWRNLRSVAKDRRMPSTSEAWFCRSAKTMSWRPRMDGERQVRLEAGGDDQRGLAVEELRQPVLQLLVQRQGAVEQARAGARGAELLHRLDRRFLHPRVRAQAQVVVGAHHDDPAALDLDLGGTVRLLDRPEVRVEPRGLGDAVVLPAPALLENVTHGGLLWWGRSASADLQGALPAVFVPTRGIASARPPPRGAWEWPSLLSHPPGVKTRAVQRGAPGLAGNPGVGVDTSGDPPPGRRVRNRLHSRDIPALVGGDALNGFRPPGGRLPARWVFVTGFAEAVTGGGKSAFCGPPSTDWGNAWLTLFDGVGPRPSSVERSPGPGGCCWRSRCWRSVARCWPDGWTSAAPSWNCCPTRRARSRT